MRVLQARCESRWNYLAADSLSNLAVMSEFLPPLAMWSVEFSMLYKSSIVN